ncbi:MAG: DeoR/GlpR transcriptional regulator, partial [Planctomycetes bacterium]|nr:DeoR/GlpR transcriptional regulator [Planctomycetota bacterium]
SQLSDCRFATVPKLAQHCTTSEATVRRDLTKLAEQGVVNRLHGGAEIVVPGSSLPAADPYSEPDNLSAKIRIARAAAERCVDDECIIIDSGSTTFQMCNFLEHKKLTIITNSMPIAQQLYNNSDNKIVVAAGEITRSHHAIFNPFGDDIFARYSCSKVFMGVQGLDQQGATNDDTRVIQAEQQMLNAAKERILLVDSSKLGKAGDLRLCGYDMIDCLITDAGISDEYRQVLERKDLELVLV